MIYDIRQFHFGESDVTKIRLSAVSNANEFIQETRHTSSGFPSILLGVCRRTYSAGTGISTSVDQGPYCRPVAVLVCKSDVPGHLY